MCCFEMKSSVTSKWIYLQFAVNFSKVQYICTCAHDLCGPLIAPLLLRDTLYRGQTVPSKELKESGVECEEG